MRAYLRASLFTLALWSTAWAQEEPPLELAARSASASDSYAYYNAMIEAYTGSPAGDEVWVIGMRGLGPDGKRHESSWNAGPYGDTLVVVSPDGSVKEFLGSTVAGQERSGDCPFGIPQLRPGQYQATPIRGRGPAPVWRLLTSEGSESLPAWLDRDGNGVISSDEKELDEHYGTKAKALELGSGTDPKRPQSVGAQTLSPVAFEAFAAAVGKRDRFRYLLLDANYPVKEDWRDLRALAAPLGLANAFGFYEKIALRLGVNPGFPVLVVLLRGVDPEGVRHDSGDNMGPYNDTFVVLSRFGGGQVSVRAFLGSSHAGQASTSRSPGYYAGIAQLRPGLYFARSNDIYCGQWSWHVVNNQGDYDGYVPVWRDRDKDGYISVRERQVAEANGVTASDILIHNGVSDEVGNSIGCVTMPPDIMCRFIDEVGAGSSFPLLVLDANSVQAAGP